MYKGFRIIDGHTHYSLNVAPEYMLRIMDLTGTDTANLAAVSHSRKLSCVPEALMLKAMYPGRFFVYASLDASEYYRDRGALGESMARYARRMLSIGCDGLKLLEGKPQVRKRLPVPDFDDGCWEPFWQYAEEAGAPILWHVNDPETFCDAAAVPDWAKKQGWYYDGSYINNEAQYAQVLRVLARHRGLKIIFAHMFFMSAQLDRLAAIMESCPRVMVDLTPGIELYENLSADRAGAEAFFARFSRRIIYGTDIGGRCVLDGEYRPFNEAENLRRPEIVRQYLAGEEGVVRSDGSFLVGRPDFTLRPPRLTREQREDIFSGNFLRFTGGEPKSADAAGVLTECARLRERLKWMESAGAAPRPDLSGFDTVEAYFGRR